MTHNIINLFFSRNFVDHIKGYEEEQLRGKKLHVDDYIFSTNPPNGVMKRKLIFPAFLAAEDAVVEVFWRATA